MKKEIEAFVNAANEQELEAAWNNLSAEEQRDFRAAHGGRTHPKMHWHFSPSCMTMPRRSRPAKP